MPPPTALAVASSEPAPARETAPVVPAVPAAAPPTLPPAQTSPAANTAVVVAPPVPSAPSPPALAPAAPAASPAPTPVGASLLGATPVPVAEAARSPYKDGIFFGWGSCRHGDIQACVEIKGGRIIAASISQCLTRYSCDIISMLPGQVVARQSSDVDYISGATQSADAFHEAVIEALYKAQ